MPLLQQKMSKIHCYKISAGFLNAGLQEELPEGQDLFNWQVRLKPTAGMVTAGTGWSIIFSVRHFQKKS
jgi:hypothetical protein